MRWSVRSAVCTLLIAGAAVTPAVATAQTACTGVSRMDFGGNPRPSLRLAQVRADVKRLFIVSQDTSGDGTGPCPDASERCRSHSYLVGGDVVVLTGPTKGDFACYVYTDPKTGYTFNDGYLPLRQLQPLQSLGLVAADWSGTWVRRTSYRPQEGGETARLQIRPLADGRYAVHGSTAPDDRKYAGTTVKMILGGEFDVVVTPIGPNLDFAIGPDGRALPFDAMPDASASSICRIRMQRIGPYLVMQENLKCEDGIDFGGPFRRMQ